MPETTPLIKAALNLRGGAGFDVYGQKEGEVVPKVVNREPIFGVLFSPPSPRFLAVAVWHSLS